MNPFDIIGGGRVDELCSAVIGSILEEEWMGGHCFEKKVSHLRLLRLVLLTGFHGQVLAAPAELVGLARRR